VINNLTQYDKDRILAVSSAAASITMWLALTITVWMAYISKAGNMVIWAYGFLSCAEVLFALSSAYICWVASNDVADTMKLHDKLEKLHEIQMKKGT